MVADAYIAWGTLAVWLVMLAMYGVRVAMRGVARSERVERIGGTMLVEYKPFEPAFYHTDIADWGKVEPPYELLPDDLGKARDERRDVGDQGCEVGRTGRAHERGYFPGSATYARRHAGQQK